MRRGVLSPLAADYNAVLWSLCVHVSSTAAAPTLVYHHAVTTTTILTPRENAQIIGEEHLYALRSHSSTPHCLMSQRCFEVHANVNMLTCSQ